MTTILHAIAGYFFLLLILRVLTRRPGAQLTPFDFVIVFLMGGIIILSTVGDDHSETNSVCAVITVGLMHRLVSSLKSRYAWIGSITDGKPIVLIKDGQWQVEAMNRAHLQDTDIMAAARERGIKTLDAIKYAILERQGAISIISSEAN